MNVVDSVYGASPRNVNSGLVFATHKKAKKSGQLAQSMRPTVVDVTMEDDIKYVTFLASNNATVSSTGTVTKLSGGVAQGVSGVQRTGDEIGLLSWSLNCSIHTNGDVDGAIMRLILFRWQLTDSVAAPTSANILELITAAYAPCSPYNQSAVRQNDFSILWDETFVVGGNGPCAAVARVEGKLGGASLRFDPGLTTGQGHLYLLAISSKAATQPLLNCVTRIYFEQS